MSWTLLITLVLGLGIALLATLARRQELARMEQRVDERRRAVRAGAHEAQLQHPVIDLSRCLGCATCVAACPETGVLELVHGQAVVVNGARCKGISACERECPVGAITVTLTKLEERRDVPVVSEELEAIGRPGVFLAGEVTAHALIKTAVDHGTAIAGAVARRLEHEPRAAHDDATLDLCIVGAGPAGLACALEAKRRGLSFTLLDQEQELGGTVAKYPRRKLVLTEPVVLPLHGRLGGRSQRSFTKEQLIELWQRIAREQELSVRGGVRFLGLDEGEQGEHLVQTSAGELRARNVCLALGRRGTPNALGVPGEELSKVAYALLDAHSYQGRRLLVVGGGDSAVEAALALADQPGNEVTLSYRREGFFRIRARNEERLRVALERGRLALALRSRVLAIHPEAVELEVQEPDGPRVHVLANDEVFVLAGGVAPTELLERSGVSFDPALRAPAPAPSEQGTGLVRALAAGFALSLAALAWALWHGEYYRLPAELRPTHDDYLFLRPSLGAGLWFGVAGTLLVLVNLLYLVRRSASPRWQIGSLSAWMTSHVATGVLALLCALLHAGMAPRDTVGGHALSALVVLLVSGAIGRYLYAWVPRAANGRELELDETRLALERASEGWSEGQRGFADRVRAVLAELVDARQWRGSFLGRASGLLLGQRDLRRALARLAREGAEAGIPQERVRETLVLARRAHRTALMAAHYEDLRAVLASWRWVHRWVAALLVLLLALHVVYAFGYGAHLGEEVLP